MACYLIGGPADLTKLSVPNPLPQELRIPVAWDTGSHRWASVARDSGEFMGIRTAIYEVRCRTSYGTIYVYQGERT